jgi:hypothetical protein
VLDLAARRGARPGGRARSSRAPVAGARPSPSCPPRSAPARVSGRSRSRRPARSARPCTICWPVAELPRRGARRRPARAAAVTGAALPAAVLDCPGPGPGAWPSPSCPARSARPSPAPCSTALRVSCRSRSRRPARSSRPVHDPPGRARSAGRRRAARGRARSSGPGSRGLAVAGLPAAVPDLAAALDLLAVLDPPGPVPAPGVAPVLDLAAVLDLLAVLDPPGPGHGARRSPSCPRPRSTAPRVSCQSRSRRRGAICPAVAPSASCGRHRRRAVAAVLDRLGPGCRRPAVAELPAAICPGRA